MLTSLIWDPRPFQSITLRIVPVCFKFLSESGEAGGLGRSSTSSEEASDPLQSGLEEGQISNVIGNLCNLCQSVVDPAVPSLYIVSSEIDQVETRHQS